MNHLLILFCYNSFFTFFKNICTYEFFEKKKGGNTRKQKKKVFVFSTLTFIMFCKSDL